MMNFDDLLLQMEEDLNEMSEEEEVIEDTNIQNNTTNVHDEVTQNYLQTINQQCEFETFIPTNPRISIITVCASINVKAEENKTKDFINKDILMEYCCQKCMGIYENVQGHHCEVIKRKKSKKIGGFYNQKTLLIPISQNKKKNFKIFWNGKVQMTGLKSTDEGYEVIQKFIEIVSNIDKTRKQQKLPTIIKNYDHFLTFNI